MKRRNGTIELMRFVFSMVIVVYHINSRYWPGGYFFSDSISFFGAGYIGVEFFFLVSGYLMGASADRKNAAGLLSGPQLGEETLSFLWRKIRSILPYHLMFILFTYGIKILQNQGANLKTFVLDQMLPDLFFLGRTGLMAPTKNNEWYLTTMFFAMLILYPLCRKFGKNFFTLAAPVVSILLLGYLMQSAGTLGVARGWNGWIYQCTLRAMGELCLGLICYSVSNWLKRQSFSRRKQVFLTILELCGYLIALCFACTVDAGAYSYYALLALAVSVSITFSCQSLSIRCPLLQNPVVLFLGKISLPIFLLQGIVASVIQMLVEGSAKFVFLLTCAAIVLVSSLVYLGVERLEQHWASKKRSVAE